MSRQRRTSRAGHWAPAACGLGWMILVAAPNGRAQDATRIPTTTQPPLSIMALPQTQQPQAQPQSQSQSQSQAQYNPAYGVLQALRNDPITGPYPISAEVSGRRLVLWGRVGSKGVHDQAVRIAIVANIPIDDRLVIDTSLARLVAAAYPATNPGALANVAPSGFAAATLPYSSAYGYPPNLVGGPGYTSPYFDPFYTFNPPVASFPPWWVPLTARRAPERFMPPPGLPGDPNQAQGQAQLQPPAADPNNQRGRGEVSPSGQPGSVEVTIDDASGVATIRGEVANEADKAAVGQRISRERGITQVVNELTTRDALALAPRLSNQPPPPPEPYVAPPANNASTTMVPGAPRPVPSPPPAAEAPAADPDAALGGRLARSLAHRPEVAAAGVKAAGKDGIVTLTGKVPTIYEAMLAYRAVEQTPGVRTIVDRLEFEVPSDRGVNPLIDKGKPEDVEPYLAAQIRRQVDDRAHIDRVRLDGDTVEVRGSIERGEDRARVEAILRSMPALRGFRVAPMFVAEVP